MLIGVVMAKFDEPAAKDRAAMPSSAPDDATSREKGIPSTRENLEKTVSPPASCEPRLDERREKKKEKKREARRRAAQKKARQVAAREAWRQVSGAPNPNPKPQTKTQTQPNPASRIAMQEISGGCPASRRLPSRGLLPNPPT